jgi:ATP-dependent exoDNAse (exonuclease V) beta subunit
MVWLDLVGHLKFVGVVDRMESNGDTWTIIDYKTSTSIKGHDDEEYKNQLLTYAIAVRKEFGGMYTQLQGKIIYLHFHTEQTFVITDEMITAHEAKLRARISDI